MYEVFNIIAAILLCIGCFLILWATISLARRRFFNFWHDKKQIIIALCCFLAAALIFVPTKSSSREVKQALSSIAMAITRTEINPQSVLKCTITTTAGTEIGSAKYEAVVFDDGVNKAYAFALKQWENGVFPTHINLYTNNIKDTVYNKATENRSSNKTSFVLEKGLKSVFGQKGKIKEILKKGYLGADDNFLKQFNSKASVYQWVETYNIDKSGLTGFQIYFNGKDHEGRAKQLIYIFELVQ